MPFMYTDQLATPGTLTTNASANTETDTFFLKPGSTRSIYLNGLALIGSNAAQTTLSAIKLRTAKFGTASTGGTTLSSVAGDPSMPSTTITSGSRPTAGTTRTNAGPIMGGGVSSGGTWWTNDYDQMVSLAAGNAGSIDVFDVAAAASLVFEFSANHREM